MSRFFHHFFMLAWALSSWGSKQAWAQESEASTIFAYEEPSRYGKFNMVKGKDSCKVSYASTIGKQLTTPLFASEQCSSTTELPGLYSIGAEVKVGSVEFPFLAPNGDEFHLFSIATAGGGNACAGSDYWAVVVNGDNIWVTKSLFGGCESMTKAKVSEKEGKTIVSFVSDVGTSYLVSMGRLETVVPKKKARSIKSTNKYLLAGELTPEGPRYARELPILTVDAKTEYIIDYPGDCPFSSFEDGDLVQMTVSYRLWSDGISDLTCLSLKKK